MLFIIFPVVHQPSSGGSCDDEDSWCSECAGREGGAAGVMEGRGVAVAGLMGEATLSGGVSIGDNRVAKFLQGEAEELRVVTAGVVVVDAVAVVPVGAAVVQTTRVAAVEVIVAEGMKGLASTLRADPTANVVG